MPRFLYLVRHGDASPHDGPLSATGREQARLVAQRLRPVPLSAICHGPLPRAAQTAAIIAGIFPGVPVTASELAGDYIPPADSPADGPADSPADGPGGGPTLPARFAALVASYSPAERAHGRELALAARERFFSPGPAAGADTHELVVTHNFLIGWLVSQALAAPAWRWLGLNQMNAALTVIACAEGEPPRLINFNDAAHLPPELRWTGFPPAATPPSR